MKKILYLFAFLLFSVVAQAQSVTTDIYIQQSENGFQIVQSQQFENGIMSISFSKYFEDEKQARAELAKQNENYLTAASFLEQELAELQAQIKDKQTQIKALQSLYEQAINVRVQ